MGSPLTGLDIALPYNNLTEGVKSSENLLGAFGRFQYEIDNATNSVTGNSTTISDGAVSFGELAIDTDGTGDGTTKYDSGFLKIRYELVS